MEELFLNVVRVECRSTDGFSIKCRIKERYEKPKEVEVYGYIATDPLSTRREVDTTGIYYGVSGDGICTLREYIREDGTVKKILDCRRRGD